MRAFARAVGGLIPGTRRKRKETRVKGGKRIPLSDSMLVNRGLLPCSAETRVGRARAYAGDAVSHFTARTDVFTTEQSRETV